MLTGSGICPSCGKDPKNLDGVDLTRTKVSIRAGEPLPNRCIECGSQTSDKVRVLFDDTGHNPHRFWLVTVLLAVLAMLGGWLLVLTRRTRPTIDVDLPLCRECKGIHGSPVPRHVDWSTHEITVVVDKKFRKALERIRRGAHHGKTKRRSRADAEMPAG